MIEAMSKPLLISDEKKRAAERLKSSIAMTVLLVSFSMLFATLILAFVVFRLSADSWPPMGMERLPLFYPALSTLIIIASSGVFESYVHAVKKSDHALARLLLILTLVLGLGFMVTQTLLWSLMQDWGYLVDTGIFASMIYGFTWIHAAHIVLGLLWLLFLWPTVKTGSAFESYEIRIISAGKFWHFLGIVWVLLFITLFVV